MSARMSAPFTASKFELALRCPGSFTLPQDPTSNPFAQAGVEEHAADEEAIERGDVPELYLERWPGFTWRAEVAFAYDLMSKTARELGRGLSRNYGALAATEVAGTADVVGLGPVNPATGARSIVIVDRKRFAEVASARTNPQLGFLALAASAAYGNRVITVAINHQLRGLDVAELDEWDLEVTDAMLRKAYEMVVRGRGGEARFDVGPQCRWCAAFFSCPQQRDLATLVRSGAAETRIESTIPFGSDDSANDAYELRGRLRIMLKRLDSALYARATERPIPLRSGKFFGPHTKQGNEKLDGDITYAVVKALHGQGVADLAVERKASKTRLRDALGVVGVKGQVASLERKVLDEVRARGGAARETKTEVIEYEPQLELAEGSR